MCINGINIIKVQIYSGITCGRVFNGELYTQNYCSLSIYILAYKLFCEDFSPLIRTVGKYMDKLTSVLFVHYNNICMNSCFGIY